MSGWHSLKTLRAMGVKLLGSNINVSKYCRLYNPSNIILHNNIRIDDFTILTAKEPIEIGNYVHIASHCLLASAKGIHIHNFSGISSGCKLYGGTDDFTGEGLTGPLVPNKYRIVSEGEIVLEEHTIIGTNSVVLPGVTLAEGTSIAACSFVNKGTDTWGIYGGIPIRRIKERKKDCLQYVKEIV
jgi:acetyltransferase-like isoleucine patch superfamily enzyme